MHIKSTLAFNRLDIPASMLDLDYTLASGQTFRWKIDDEGFWSAPVRGLVIRIKRDGEGLIWQTYPRADDFDLVKDYFRLDDDVEEVYRVISQADPTVAGLVKRYGGLRFVRQEPQETILSFVCSAANSIPRIMVAIEALSRHYGAPVAEIAERSYFSFPPTQALADASPDDLARTASLGFRGVNLQRVASQLAAKGPDWLPSLRELPYMQARAELMTLDGIGPKIADCVCLFSLDKDESVPVDTHVRQIAARLYLPDMKAKSVTTGVYERVIKVFQERFGPYAGWAQQFLYYDDIQPGRRKSNEL